MIASSPEKRRASPARKPGGQSGNTNALKHGIYSAYYTSQELLALDRDVAGSLKDELEILRLCIAEVVDSVIRQPESDMPFHDHVSALRTVSVAVARLENIIHTRVFVLGNPDRREKQVDAILEDMERSEVDGVGAAAELPRTLSASPSSVPGRASAPQDGTSAFKKKIGAQPGNSNAWKHGFYAAAFTSAEKDRLQGTEMDQLQHEETLIRVLILRAWRSLRSVRSAITYQEYLFTLRGICYAIYVIARLQRSRRRLFGDMTDLEKDIQLGVAEACADLGILDYFNRQVNK
jgi:hypothetical protein